MSDDIHEKLGIVIGKLDGIEGKMTDFICEQRDQHKTLESRVGEIESWKDVMVGKLSVIISVIALLFTSIGYWIKSKFQ